MTLYAVGANALGGPVKPTVATTGPRGALTDWTGPASLTGFNQTPDGDGIVRISGKNFPSFMSIHGTNGGSHTILGYEFTDCALPAGFLVYSDLYTAPAGIKFSYCTSGAGSTIENAGFPVAVDHCRGQGTNGIGVPLQLWRYTTAGATGTALLSTPTTVTDSILAMDYPWTDSAHHGEALHIRGGKDMTFTRCVFDCGWSFNPDGSTPPVTSNLYLEGGFGGNDNIVFDTCWHYGGAPFYFFKGEGTNIVFRNGYIAQVGAYLDQSAEGGGAAAPAVQYENKGGQTTDFAISGYRWEKDNTPVGPGVLVLANNAHTTTTWA